MLQDFERVSCGFGVFLQVNVRVTSKSGGTYFLVLGVEFDSSLHG